MIFDPEADNEKVFDEEIMPLRRQIVEICKQAGIALVSICQYSQRGHGTTVIVSPGASSLMYDVARVAYPEGFTAESVATAESKVAKA